MGKVYTQKFVKGTRIYQEKDPENEKVKTERKTPVQRSDVRFTVK